MVSRLAFAMHMIVTSRPPLASAAAFSTSPSADEATACRAALRINLAAGDYVEACYPYMARSPAVNAAAYAGAAMAGAVLLEAGGAARGAARRVDGDHSRGADHRRRHRRRRGRRRDAKRGEPRDGGVFPAAAEGLFDD